jgi:hypothetical protein
LQTKKLRPIWRQLVCLGKFEGKSQFFLQSQFLISVLVRKRNLAKNNIKKTLAPHSQTGRTNCEPKNWVLCDASCFCLAKSRLS